MLKLLSMLSYFFKELFFDSKEEYDIKSSKFNIRKTLAFTLTFTSFALNMFLVNRIYDLATENIKLTEEVTKLQALKVPSKEKFSANSGKNTTETPSDSRKRPP
jgi:hypothetical protein